MVLPRYIDGLLETAFALALDGGMEIQAAMALTPSMAGDFFASKAFENRQKTHDAELKATLNRLESIVKVLCQLPKAMR